MSEETDIKNKIVRCNESLIISDVEEESLSPHPVIVRSGNSYSIIGENHVLMKDLDLFNAIFCLLCIYYSCDIQYATSGLKCMLFLQTVLAEIPYSKKMPFALQKMVSAIKRFEI